MSLWTLYSPRASVASIMREKWKKQTAQRHLLSTGNQILKVENKQVQADKWFKEGDFLCVHVSDNDSS